ncbi:MAG: polyprenol phosphomannose-dependent alpha 1,6 mannosyltransferase MptB [Propionibacteriaceae bacterium]|nr:polyprenol phosphomannose-dependent alpha 1,6 mannosyltransferase MptB [Propionibacteriaceae bacterium]
MERSGTTDTSSSTGLVATLRTPGVILGMVAMLIIGIAVMTPGFVPNRGLDQIGALKFLRSVLTREVGRIVMAVGLVLLLWAWVKLRPGVHGRLNHGLILALWSLPVLIAPPIFSSDAFLYADQGWIISQGLDPYQVGLTDAGGPFAANVHPAWQHTTAVYPPAALLVQYLVTEVTGYRGLISVVAMRIPALLAVVVIALGVPRLARALKADVETAKWFAVINPLLLLHFVGGMHNDAWMVALVVVAAISALRFGIGGMRAGAVLVGIGAAFNPPGLAAAIAIGLLPVAARLKDLTLGKRLATMIVYCGSALIIAAGTFVVVSLAIGYEFLGWMKATGIHETTWGMSPSSMVEQIIGPLAREVGIDRPLLPMLSTFTTLLSLVVGALIAWRYFFADRIAARPLRLRSVRRIPGGEAPKTDRSWRDHPLRWLAWSFTALGFGGAGFHVWYMLWGGIYLGMLRYGNRMFRALIAAIIALIVMEAGLEYYSLRPIPGILFGSALGWIFFVNSSALQIVADAEHEDAHETKGVMAA